MKKFCSQKNQRVRGIILRELLIEKFQEVKAFEFRAENE